ncbi:unnamed protein product [Calypogeia fissa]
MGSNYSEVEAEVKLLTHRCSPYSQTVQIALLEKGIPFEPIYMSLPRKPTLLLETNPVYRQVPVIIHKGRTLSQSLVILEYLEDVFPEKIPLVPKDPYERAKVRFWADFLHRGYTHFFNNCMKLQPGCPLKDKAMESALKFMRMVDAAMASYSTDGPFFTGPQFGFLDAVFAPFSTSLMVLEKLDGFVMPWHEEIPRLYSWIEAVRARPSVISSIPSVDEHADFVTGIFHADLALQLHLQELNAPPNFPHPRASSSENMMFSSHILVYES